MPNPRGLPTTRKLIVNPQQKLALRQLIQQPRSWRSLAFRARIVLEVPVDRTMLRWRPSCALPASPWACGEIALSGAGLQGAVRLTLQEDPTGATHWSSRALVARTGLSQSTVSRIWRAFGRCPQRRPLLGDSVRAIVGRYMNPPHHARVLCVEKSRMQALSRSQPSLSMLPGQVEGRTHHYQRHGTTSLFPALDIATGSVMGKCWSRQRAIE